MFGMSIERPWIHIGYKTRERIVFIIALICLFLFVLSASEKLIDHKRFLSGLKRVPLIGPYALFISWAVPIVELCISTLLFIPKRQMLGLNAFIGVMLVFTLYITTMVILFPKKDLPCSCNLIVEQLSWPAHIAFNMAFVGIATFALWLKRKTD